MPRENALHDSVLCDEDRLPPTHMPIRMKSTGKHDWTLLLRARSLPQSDPGFAGQGSSAPASEQQERIANSKLERLAAELRALGIQF